MAGKSVNFCIFCKKKLSFHPKYILCLDCKLFKLEKSKCNPDFIEKTYANDMKYCYNCGEELFIEENASVCVECDFEDAVEFHDQPTSRLTKDSSHHGLDSPLPTPKQPQGTTPPGTALNPQNETVKKDAEVKKTPTGDSFTDSHASSNDENSKKDRTCKEDGNQLFPKNTRVDLVSTDLEQKPISDTMQEPKPVDLTDQPLHPLVNPVEESQTKKEGSERSRIN